MENNIARNLNFLELLCKSKCKVRKELVKNATKDQIMSICEIIFNILHGVVSLSPDDISKLSKRKETLRQLVKKRSSIKHKKLLIQKGGFLQFIIPALITGIASVVSSVIEKS